MITEVIEIKSAIKYKRFDRWFRLEVVILCDGEKKEMTFMAQNPNELKRIKVGYKYKGNYFGDEV